MIPHLNKFFIMLLAALFCAAMVSPSFAQPPGMESLEDFDTSSGVNVDLGNEEANKLGQDQPINSYGEAEKRREELIPIVKRLVIEGYTEKEAKKKADELLTKEEEEDEKNQQSKPSLIVYLTILVLSIFVGFEIITKVPPTLHTPLMSGSNAISGITLIGAIISGAGGIMYPLLTLALCFFAVVFATVNVVGGFLVTHRMLGMFRKKG